MNQARIAGLAAGRDHSLALMADGNVWGWGGDGSGRALLPELCSAAPPTSPIIVPVSTALTRLAAGFGVSYGITEHGGVHLWGASRSGLAGQVQALSTAWPQALMGLENIRAVAAGEFFGLALDGSGQLYSWGLMPDATAGVRNTPPRKLRLAGSITAVSVGGGHVLALDDEGSVHGWGANGAGQLGRNDLLDSATPRRVVLETPVRAIAAGLTHSLALDTDGGLWAWGSNQHGQLGTDAFAYSPRPIRLELPHSVHALAAGMYFSLALDDRQQVHSWGWNAKGQLGRKAGRASAQPGLVNGLPPILHLAAGQGHVMASDGHTIHTWGDNAASQLGPRGPRAEAASRPAWAAAPLLLLS